MSGVSGWKGISLCDEIAHLCCATINVHITIADDGCADSDPVAVRQSGFDQQSLDFDY